MTAVSRPRTAAELQELLRSRPGRVRLCGTGSHQDRLPDAGRATRVHLSGLDTIEVDVPDLTCSVGAGVDRTDLDRVLQTKDLELPCAGTGSLGGLFASDPIGATTIGGAAPRTLLLGLEGVLADGTAFRSGARVVKSVAGFDVHKLLVGSNGRLFAATRLHLRLAPRPRAAVWFCRSGLDQAQALALFMLLRGLAWPPTALHLSRRDGDFLVTGRMAGRPNHVDATLRAHALPVSEPFTALHLHPGADGETVTGTVLPSHVPRLLALVPPNASFVLHGGGRYELALPGPAATDGLLEAAPSVPTHVCIVHGEPGRRGKGSPLDPGQQRLTTGLTQALDPDGIFV